MKTNFILIFLFISVVSYGQSVDSTFYTGSSQLRQIKLWNKTKDTVQIQEWYPNGQKLAILTCITEERRLAPIPQAKIFYENGNLFQLLDNNNLLTYTEDGKVMEKLSFNYKDTTNVTIEYYENGNKKTEKIFSIPNDGRKLITGLWFGYSPNQKRSYIYQQGKGSPISTIEYYPNGKVMHLAKTILLPGGRGGYWKHEFYDSTGKPAKDTKYQTSDPQWPTKYIKNGVWITYYRNGQMEKKENFKDDYLDGEQWYWFENGQLKEHSVYNNGFKKIIKSFTEDGKPSNK